MKQKINNTDKIPEGAFLVARKIFNDELWRRKPSSWTKIFIYILGKVNHTAHGGLKRGEGFFNFSEEIRDIGIDITPDKAKKFLCFARKNSILDTTRSTRGMIVKVLNYNKYQDLNNYKGTTSGTSEAREKHERSTPIYNNDKKANNEKNVRREFTPPSLKDVTEYFQEKGYTDEIAFKAWIYYEENEWRDSKGNKVKNWKQKMASWFDDKNKKVIPGKVDLSKMEYERQNHLS